MKEELLKKSILQLEEDLLQLRKTKSGIYSEIDIFQNEKKSLNNRNIEIQKTNTNLQEKNKELEYSIVKYNDNIDTLIKREKELIKIIDDNNIINNSLLSLNKSIEENVCTINKDEVLLKSSNNEIDLKIKNKKFELHNIDNNIIKSEEKLNIINKDIQNFYDKKNKLEKKENDLGIKSTELKRKEIRLEKIKLKLFNK